MTPPTKETAKQGPASTVRPKKDTHFGKANPKRDACLFLVFLAFMLIVSCLFQETGEPTKNKTKWKIPSLSEIRQQQRILEHSFQQGQASGFAPDTNCASLLLGQSSIPGAGWGVFVSKQFDAGEVILGSAPKTGDWPLTLEDIEWRPDMPREIDSINDNKLFNANLPTFSILLKPHSVLFNAAWVYDGNNDFPRLVATKHISPGDEIFVQRSDHLYNIFPNFFGNIPTVEQFKRADAIIQETREVFKILGNSVQKRRVADINKGLQALRKAMNRYDRNVATLLPLKVSDLLLYNNKTSTSEVNALKQQPFSSLLESSRCLSNIHWTRKNLDSEHQPILSREYIEEGELIMPVPLLLQWTGDGNQRPSESQGPDAVETSKVCSFPKDSLTSLLPPLSSQSPCSLVKDFDGNKLGYSLCPLNGFVPMTSNHQEANARYQWSARSDQHKVFLNALRNASSLNGLPSTESIQKHGLAMSWDLVATRKIKQDEIIKIFAGVEEGLQAA